MSWDDNSYGKEFYKFRAASNNEQMLYDDKLDIGIMEVLWDTITDYKSDWNKDRKRVQVYQIIECRYSRAYDSDTVDMNSNIYLDLGGRLYLALKPFGKIKTKYVRIEKFTNPSDKFDVRYHVVEYKLLTQKQVDDFLKAEQKLIRKKVFKMSDI